MKKILTVVLFITALSTSMLLTSCKDTITQPGTVSNPNLVKYTISLKERLLPTDSNSVDIRNGIIVGDNDANRDIEMPDSLATGRYFLRSGDGTMPASIVSAIGYETMFTTGWSLSQNQFDTLQTYPYNSGSIQTTDFTRHTTYGFADDLSISTPYRAYGIYLKGRSGSTTPIYGMIYLRSSDREGDGSFRLTFDVRLNLAGLNQFGDTVPFQ